MTHLAGEDIGPDDEPALYPSARPVMDQAEAAGGRALDLAATNKRNQDIIESVKGIVVAALGLLPLLWVDLISAQQLGGILLVIGAVFVSLQVILGRKGLVAAQADAVKSIEEARAVEALVTPVGDPKDDAGNPLTPGVIGSHDKDTLPPI